VTGPAPAAVTAAVTGTSALVRHGAALRFFGVPGGELRAELEAAGPAALAADGRTLALLGRDGGVRVLGGPGVPAERLAPHPGALAVAGDGCTLAVASAGEPGRLELFRDGAAVARAELGAAGRVGLHGDATLGCLAVEWAAGAGAPVLRAAYRFDGDALERFWEGAEDASVAGPALGGALFLSGPQGVVRRAPGTPDRSAPGTPADLLSATPDARRLLAARPLEYTGAAARVLLRLLDAVTLEERARGEATIADWSVTRLAATPDAEVLTLRAAPGGLLAVEPAARLT